ncbi:MAG: tetratricopeptide repeat protein [Gammaproteobacteria bacterium]|nr:tetratricopeptide repeat protein [Gammaproteobacteria bacterium]
MSAGTQSMTVLGGDSYARDCYAAASMTARRHFGSRESITDCTHAIQYGRLSMRDRLATYVNRGILYMAQKDFERAAKDYETAVGLNPPSGEVFVNRGNLSFLTNAYSDAINEYTRALELGLEKDHIAYYNRAMAYERVRNFDGAEADYRRAIELKPQWFMPQARLDSLLRAVGKPSLYFQN